MCSLEAVENTKERENTAYTDKNIKISKLTSCNKMSMKANEREITLTVSGLLVWMCVCVMTVYERLCFRVAVDTIRQY